MITSYNTIAHTLMNIFRTQGKHTMTCISRTTKNLYMRILHIRKCYESIRTKGIREAMSSVETCASKPVQAPLAGTWSTWIFDQLKVLDPQSSTYKVATTTRPLDEGKKLCLICGKWMSTCRLTRTDSFVVICAPVHVDQFWSYPIGRLICWAEVQKACEIK